MEEKVLDVDATMQGTMIFKDPVNLKINGRFEGNLTTRGSLTIGPSAEVTADIIGENIVISGRVVGDVIAEKSLKLLPPARVVGNVETPSLTVAEGALLHGDCRMIFDEAEVNSIASRAKKGALTAEEVARYLEVDASLVLEWADSGRLHGRKENNNWRFERSVVDEWIKNEKIK
jgi:excisionase family DNA binding protein